jgi:hypothetical protein
VLAVALTPPEDPMLSREEWALLALVDGRRAVSDVVGATGRGEFAVVSALASLVDRGLLVVTGDGQPPAVAALLRRLSALTTVEGVGPVVDPVERRAVGVDDAVAPPDAPLPDDLAAAVPDDTEIDLDAAVAPEQREPLELEQSGPLAEADDSMPGADAEPVVPPLAEEGDDVVAPRAESLRGRRRPSHQDDDFASASAGSTHPIIGQVDGTAAVAPEMAPTPGLIERDPSVNKSLLLRLIAGVRGL